jgi:arabinan endo-1,5-alpha-L-arabinosidase
LHTRSPETNASWEGPGHCSVIKSLQGNWAIVYHAWPHGEIGKTKRIMLVDKLTFQNGWPVVGDGSPSETTQPDF